MTKKANVAIYKQHGHHYYAAWSRDEKTNKSSTYGNFQYLKNGVVRCNGSYRSNAVRRVAHLLDRVKVEGDPNGFNLLIYPMELFT